MPVSSDGAPALGRGQRLRRRAQGLAGGGTLWGSPPTTSASSAARSTLVPWLSYGNLLLRAEAFGPVSSSCSLCGPVPLLSSRASTLSWGRRRWRRTRGPAGGALPGLAPNTPATMMSARIWVRRSHVS